MIAFRFALPRVCALVLTLVCAEAVDAKEAASTAPVTLAYFQKGNIHTSGLRGSKTVALTFDDGPNENTRGVLDVLRANGVKATFFVVGRMARQHPDILREIAAEGHLLANHSATHAKLGQRYVRNPRLLLNQIRTTHNYIAPLMQEGETLFFRAPYGYWKKPHAKQLNADPVLRHYTGPIYWDIGGETHVDSEGYVRRSADWDCWHRGWRPATCAKGYLRETRAKQGGVVLMHSIHRKSGGLVDAIVPTLLDEGYRFVRLDEIREYDQYKTPGPPSLRPEIAEGDGKVRVAVARR
jgi:peptidoglycan/xylan/chitin deacetylase (PgdA/CDA1 family)